MFGLVIIGQQVGQFFGEGADVVPVLGRDRQQGEAQAVELGQQLVFLFQAVHLVDHAKGGQAHAADVGRQIFVQGQQAVTAVHHEGHGTGVLHGRLGLAQDVGLEAADAFGAFGDHGMGIQGDAAGIHDAEIRMALARLLRIRRLNRVDLPTLGRPTRTMQGNEDMGLPSAMTGRCCGNGAARGGGHGARRNGMEKRPLKAG